MFIYLCAGAADFSGARKSPEAATESTPVQGQIGAMGQVPAFIFPYGLPEPACLAGAGPVFYFFGPAPTPTRL